MSESSRPRSPSVEATLLSIWRRLLDEGGGPELTLAEAAALLGSSVESVKRRIRTGNLYARRDGRGRIRVVPFADPMFDPTPTEAVAKLWDELKIARTQLKATLAERRSLQEDLDATKKSLELVQTELSAMWRVMSKRQGAAATGDEAPDAKPSATARIESQIASMRRIAKRRRWPWALAS